MNFLIYMNFTDALADSSWPFIRALNDLVSPFTVSYQYERLDNGVIWIYPHSGYMKSLDSPAPIKAIPPHMCCEGYFSWDFPTLSVKTANSTPNPVYFSELVFEVSRSHISTEPILIAEERYEGRLSIINEGWGPVHNPSLEFRMEVPPVQGATDGPITVSKTVTLEDFDQRSGLNFAQYLPAHLDAMVLRDTRCALSAVLSYKNAEGADRLFPFLAVVNFGPPPLSFVPASPVIYDVRLFGGVAPTTVRIPISQLANARGVDDFLVRVASDRSAEFEFAITLRSVDGKTFQAGNFVLDTFIPRSGYPGARQANSDPTK